MLRQFAPLILLPLLLAATTQPSTTPETAPSTTLQQLTAAAERGDAQAQFNLATRYINGDGVPQNDPTAFTCSLSQRYVQARDLSPPVGGQSVKRQRPNPRRNHLTSAEYRTTRTALKETRSPIRYVPKRYDPLMSTNTPSSRTS